MLPADISILSAGAVGPGLKKVTELFQQDTRETVKLTFATAPTIVERLGADSQFDIVIAPPIVLDDAARQKKISPERRVLLGRIGAGVMRSEEHTSELQSRVDISYAVFCLK